MLDLISQLARDESCDLIPYQDSLGIWTAGFGHNLEAHNIDHTNLIVTEQQAHDWLIDDVKVAVSNVLTKMPWTGALTVARRGALQNMCFNMGIEKLLGFERMAACLKVGYWTSAAAEMKASLWAKEVGERADRLETQIIAGDRFY